jgi:hypothetical protein
MSFMYWMRQKEKRRVWDKSSRMDRALMNVRMCVKLTFSPRPCDMTDGGTMMRMIIKQAHYYVIYDGALNRGGTRSEFCRLIEAL